MHNEIRFKERKNIKTKKKRKITKGKKKERKLTKEKFA